MSTKKRILFIANEMSPYVELTEFAEIINKLAVKSNDSGMEVRCIMPRFGIINERRHRLHEVVRLSGINVSIDGDDYPLVIKVASLPNARLQDCVNKKSLYGISAGCLLTAACCRKQRMIPCRFGSAYASSVSSPITSMNFFVYAWLPLSE